MGRTSWADSGTPPEMAFYEAGTTSEAVKKHLTLGGPCVRPSRDAFCCSISVDLATNPMLDVRLFQILSLICFFRRLNTSIFCAIFWYGLKCPKFYKTPFALGDKMRLEKHRSLQQTELGLLKRPIPHVSIAAGLTVGGKSGKGFPLDLLVFQLESPFCFNFCIVGTDVSKIFGGSVAWPLKYSIVQPVCFFFLKMRWSEASLKIAQSLSEHPAWVAGWRMGFLNRYWLVNLLNHRSIFACEASYPQI